MSSKPLCYEEDVKDGLLESLSQTDFPETENIRRVLACLSDLRRYGLEQLTVWEVAQILRINRVKSIGYREYLYEVLNHRARHPVKQCRLWREGKKMEVQSDYWASQPLAIYLTHIANTKGLDYVPDRVDFQEDGKTVTRCI
jgi:hypothetical protein